MITSKQYLGNKAVRIRRNDGNNPQNIGLTDALQVNTVDYPSSNHRAPHVLVRFNNILDIPALIDTGAVLSLLDFQIAKRLSGLAIRETQVTPIAANGETIPLMGQAFVTVQAGDVEETIQVCIQHNSTTMLILGTNFLSRFKRIELNWARAEKKLKEVALPCTGMTYHHSRNKRPDHA